MEMQQVRYFLAVARTLNFTRAAEQCNVTQPALTRAIRQLEDELGGELIRREGRLSHLSDLGRRMLPLLTQCYEGALGAKALAERVRAGAASSLTIALAWSFSSELVVPFLAELARQFPALALKLRRGDPAELAGWLKQGEVDLALGGPLPESWDRLDAHPIFVERFDLVVAPGHALAGDEGTIELQALAGERLLLSACEEARAALAAALGIAGISPGTTHDVRCNRDLEALVAADLGVAVLPASALRSARVRHLRCAGLGEPRAVSVYTMAGRPRSREANALLALLRMADWDERLAA